MWDGQVLNVNIRLYNTQLSIILILNKIFCLLTFLEEINTWMKPRQF